MFAIRACVRCRSAPAEARIAAGVTSAARRVRVTSIVAPAASPDPRGGTEVLRVGDPVQDHHQVVGTERPRSELALADRRRLPGDRPRRRGGRPRAHRARTGRRRAPRAPPRDGPRARPEGLRSSAHPARRGTSCAVPARTASSTARRPATTDVVTTAPGRRARDSRRRRRRGRGPSGRVALTETRSLATPRAVPNACRISSRAGAIEGRSATIVRSAETGCAPAPRTIATTRPSRSSPPMPANVGSVSGKCSPRRRARPPRASRPRARDTPRRRPNAPRAPPPRTRSPSSRRTPRRPRVHVEPETHEWFGHRSERLREPDVVRRRDLQVRTLALDRPHAVARTLEQ